jgi:hypothetical protein
MRRIAAILYIYMIHRTITGIDPSSDPINQKAANRPSSERFAAFCRGCNTS